MPWTKESARKHKKGMSDREAERWAAIANSVLKRCLAKGGSQSTCEASAIRQASGSVGSHISTFNVELNDYEIRTETHQGRKHIVVPVIMLVDGVHHGSAGRLLHTSEEYGKFAAAWNGIPVVVMHPQEDGIYVSANSPEIVDSQTVGRIYNTTCNGKLKAECWIDVEKITEISPEALEYIMEKKPLQVSTGVFTDDEIVSEGTWNDEEYEAIARNHRPDHLALLPNATGACSWNDGCGIRANKKGGENVEDEKVKINALKYSGTETTSWSAPTLSDFNVGGSKWDELSQSDKAKVASHYLIGSSSSETFGDLKLPVVNPKTGKLNEGALRAVISGRGAQVGGVSAEIKSSARRKAYRLLNSEFDAGLSIPTNLEEDGDIYEFISKLVGSGAVISDSLAKELHAKGYSVNAIGYKGICGEIQHKLDSMDSDTKIHFLEEVYGDYFVYKVHKYGSSEELYKRGYQVDNEVIEFTGEPEPVRRTIEYQVLNEKGGLKNMSKKKDEKKCCTEQIDTIIQGNTRFEEEDREWLETLEQEQIIKLLPVEPDPTPAVQADAGEAQQVEVTKEQAIEVLREQLSTPEQFLQLLPKDVQAQMRYGMSLYTDKRKETIESITANTDVFSAEELDAKDIGELTKLANAVKPKADYSALGSETPPQANTGVQPLGIPGMEATN